MTRPGVILTAMTALIGTFGAGTAQADVGHPTDVRETMQRDADTLLDYGAPGVLTELHTTQDDVRVRSGFGNVTARTPVPWNAKFRIGSFTKTFVSATLLQLVGEHRLSLEDTVDQWLPGVVRGNGNDGREISVRQLLQQTSGLPDFLQGMPYLSYQAGFDENRFKTMTPQQAVALAMKYKPAFAPGTQWGYSNTNYILAGMIINSVTGHPWQQEVRNRIVEPLGLRHTYLPDTFPLIPRPHAIGYERFLTPDSTPENPKYGEPVDATVQNPSWGGSAGEIISTTDDADHFLQALVSGKVLRPAQLAEMQKTVPTDTNFQHNWPGSRYGLGLMWIPNSCGGSWSHGGDIQGFMTRNGVSPDGSRSVIVSVNTDTPMPKAGVPAPTKDMTIDLIDHALCGTD
ncbi:MAG TPA: serine hydrolase domain-containing protein [Actinoallomurus sp.]